MVTDYGASCKTLTPFKLFVYLTDRAEILHTARYNIRDMRKNILGQNDQVELCEKSKLLVHLYYIVCTPIATQHARRQKNITLQEAKPSLRVTLKHVMPYNSAKTLGFPEGPAGDIAGGECFAPLCLRNLFMTSRCYGRIRR